MKKTRMIVAGLMAMVMMLLVACGGGNNKPADNGGKNDAQTNQQEQQPSTNNAGGEQGETPAPDAGSSTPAEFTGKLTGPFIMTTCGQSTGSVMLHMVAVQAGLTSVDDHALTAEDFSRGDANTLIITTGTSGKGMGAAGTDVDAEIERCTALAKAAKEAGMIVVCAHVEGMARRTDSADQASIDAILPLADVVICVEDSDSDGLFSNYATENNLPIIKTVDTLAMAEHME